MNILVLYQSRSGHTRTTAEAIAGAARDLNHNVVLKSVIEIQKADVKRADVLFVGTWIQGFILFGVKPAGADIWVKALPALEGKPVGIFCTYAINPFGSLDKLDALLTERGATVLGQHAFHRNHPDDGAAAFVQRVVQSAERVAV